MLRRKHFINQSNFDIEHDIRQHLDDVDKLVIRAIPEAQFEWGMRLLEEGKLYSDQVQINEGIKWLKIAAKEDAYANFNLGLWYLQHPSTDDSLSHVNFFKKALRIAKRQNDPVVMLALCVQPYIGLDLNPTEVIEEKSKQQPRADRTNDMAQLYLNACLGDVGSQFIIGRMLVTEFTDSYYQDMGWGFLATVAEEYDKGKLKEKSQPAAEFFARIEALRKKRSQGEADTLSEILEDKTIATEGSRDLLIEFERKSLGALEDKWVGSYLDKKPFVEKSKMPPLSISKNDKKRVSESQLDNKSRSTVPIPPDSKTPPLTNTDIKRTPVAEAPPDKETKAQIDREWDWKYLGKSDKKMDEAYVNADPGLIRRKESLLENKLPTRSTLQDYIDSPRSKIEDNHKLAHVLNIYYSIRDSEWEGGLFWDPSKTEKKAAVKAIITYYFGDENGNYKGDVRLITPKVLKSALDGDLKKILEKKKGFPSVIQELKDAARLAPNVEKELGSIEEEKQKKGMSRKLENK